VIIEYRPKNNIWEPWAPVNSNTLFKDINMLYYSVRINKDRQYHRLDTPGFEEAYNKAITWMKLTGLYTDVWPYW
jgi:hypothetical protein